MQELEGQVAEIIYRNEINGYTVCIFDLEKAGSITAVRIFAIYRKRRHFKDSRAKHCASRLWRTV